MIFNLHDKSNETLKKKICVKAELRKGGCYQKSKIKGELISSAE